MTIMKIHLEYRNYADGSVMAIATIEGEELPVAQTGKHLIADPESAREFERMCESILVRYLKTLTNKPIARMDAGELN